MKKLYIFMSILLAFFLYGCTTKNTTKKAEDTSEEIVMYKDGNPIEIGDTTLSISYISSSSESDGNCSFYITFDIKNNSLNTVNYSFSDLSLIKEDTGVNYNVWGFIYEVELQAELKTSIGFRSTIPSSISNDDYKFSCKLNNVRIIVYAYDTPEELKEMKLINYYVNGQLVHTGMILEGESVGSFYIHESNDCCNYCKSWYKDPTLTSPANSSSPITEDINLYGKEESIFSISSSQTDGYSYVRLINYIPTNKKIAFPSTYNGLSVAIGNYAINNKYIGGKIYVPKGVKLIYSGNFINIGSSTVIYYEGTEEEWKALFYNSGDASKITNTVIFNANWGMF